MSDSQLQFPADYATAPTVLVPINLALMPYVAGALASLENESLWASDSDYQQAYTAIVALKSMLMAYDNTPANYVLAGPVAGDPASAALRRLVVADLPAIAYSQLTGIPATFAPAAHAIQHSSGGSDPVSPASIGAAAELHTHVLAYSSLSGIPSSFTPAAHASTHATAGSDAITPAAIGASATSHTHTVTWTSITGKPATFAPTAHASQHASGGSDAITPASIAASPADHTHPLEGWTNITLGNGWVNFGSGYNTAQYYRDPYGIVHLRGLIKSGTATAGTVIATLPAGYRPAAIELFCVLSFTSTHVIGRIDVNTSGQIIIQAGGNGFIGLDNISFRVVN